MPPIRPTLIVLLALSAAVAPAVAAGPPPAAAAPPAGQPAPSPAASPSTNDQAVFVHGELNVPGASQEGDTVPAKFSTRNDAADKLATVDYTFGTLSPEQRSAIYRAVAGTEPSAAPALDGATPDVVAKAGAELPPLLPVAAFPADLQAQVPQVKGYRYARLGDKLIVVEPNTMFVVDVLSQP